ncbi:MAG: reverse transcriptase domain-containing protein [Parcubacteria group bacterium]
MKIAHNFYDKLISLENIFRAWRIFRSGKAGKKEVMEFEHNIENNLFALCEELKIGCYKHGGYERFIVRDPTERIIHKAQTRDRVVHTLVAKKLEEIYQPMFIAHSYACQQERGIHKALLDLVKFSRKASMNYRQDFWCLKCDIRKFFDNIDHGVLIDILNQKIKDEKFLQLIKAIVDGFCQGAAGKGLPLGNFTSQWLANIYLNELDYFVKQDLKAQYYLRYADDFLLLNRSRDELERGLAWIGEFLNGELKLELHPDKISIKKFSAGVEFVGYKVLPHHVLLKKSATKRMLAKMDARKSQLRSGEIGQWKYCETLNAYFGWLKHCDSYRLMNEILY